MKNVWFQIYQHLHRFFHPGGFQSGWQIQDPSRVNALMWTFVESQLAALDFSSIQYWAHKIWPSSPYLSVICSCNSPFPIPTFNSMRLFCIWLFCNGNIRNLLLDLNKLTNEYESGTFHSPPCFHAGFSKFTIDLLSPLPGSCMIFFCSVTTYVCYTWDITTTLGISLALVAFVKNYNMIVWVYYY